MNGRKKTPERIAAETIIEEAESGLLNLPYCFTPEEEQLDYQKMIWKLRRVRSKKQYDLRVSKLDNRTIVIGRMKKR